jgi:hypothetical protein
MYCPLNNGTEPNAPATVTDSTGTKCPSSDVARTIKGQALRCKSLKSGLFPNLILRGP